MIYFYYIFLIPLLFLFILKNIKVILYYFGGKYKSLGINYYFAHWGRPFLGDTKKRFGDKEEISQYFVLKLKLHIFSVPELYCTKFRPKRGVPIGRSYYYHNI